MGSNVELLAKCQPNKRFKLLHGLIDGMCQLSSTPYSLYSEIYSLEEWWKLADCVKALFSHAVSNNLDREGVSKLLHNLPDDCKQQILDVILVRKEDVKKSLLANTCGVSSSHLSDFDWNVKLAMSSDKMSSIHEALVAVDMTVTDDKTNRRVTVEMNEKEFQELVSSLERANRALQTMI